MSAKLHYNSVACGVDANIMQKRRLAHNAVKRCLINEALFFSGVQHGGKATVLDLASGRVGDLAKFKHLELEYHGADIAELALDEASRRFHEMGMRGTFHKHLGDATEVDLPLFGDADVCLINFALHYFTDSKEHCERLIQQAAKSLRKGGVMCGVYTRAALARLSPFTRALNWPTLGQFEAYPWGHRYAFDMPPFVNADEYLVPMSKVVQIAHDNNLMLMKDRGIIEYAQANSVQLEDIDGMYGVFMFIRV